LIGIITYQLKLYHLKFMVWKRSSFSGRFCKRSWEESIGKNRNFFKRPRNKVPPSSFYQIKEYEVSLVLRNNLCWKSHGKICISERDRTLENILSTNPECNKWIHLCKKKKSSNYILFFLHYTTQSRIQLQKSFAWCDYTILSERFR